MIYEYDCETCGQHVRKVRSPATVKNAGPRFCSQRCHGVARKGTGRGPTPNHFYDCEQCGAWCAVYRPPSAPQPRFCSVQCIGEAQRGERNPAYSGGRHIGLNGYVYALSPDHPHADVRGYVLEHRLVVESVLGRRLARAEVVHHINQIKTDNRPENLRLCASQAEHLAIHRALKESA